MKPQDLKTKIFLDSGDPRETETALNLLGFLEGQTTNPSLIKKNPTMAERLERGEKLSLKEALAFYQETAREIAQLIPQGSVSLEVYADKNTKAGEMIGEAREMASWIPHAHIKLPLMPEGLRAARALLQEGLRLNITLCFSQEQAAAVFAALREAGEGQVFLSPFVGRLDDRGEDGMQLIKYILEMKRQARSRVEVLTASVRKLDHLLAALHLGSDIATCPLKVLKEWAERDLVIPSEDYHYQAGELKPIPYQALDLTQPWERFDLRHPLTDAGLEKFAQDWRALIEGGG